jgi:tRNA (cytidine32/guanosine34-2'-O)-methyltransferase
LSSLLITTHVLCINGTFVAKLFRGSNIGFLYNQLRLLFKTVSIAKPSSSRNSSMESFVVCTNFIGNNYFNLPLDIVGYINLNQYCRGSNTHQDIDRQQEQSKHNCNINKEYDDKCDVDDDDNYIQRYAIPFIACGDLSGFQPKNWKHNTSSNNQDTVLHDLILDSDKSYPMNDDISMIIQPIAPPINPPYQESLQRIKHLAGGNKEQKK